MRIQGNRQLHYLSVMFWLKIYAASGQLMLSGAVFLPGTKRISSYGA